MTSRKNAKNQITTSGNTIKIETPRGRRKPNVSVVVGAVNPIGGFVGFLREHAIVGLAVGFVIGTQVQSIVKQLISGFIDPFSKLLFPGDQALSNRTFTLHFNGRYADFGWGALAYQLIDFLFILFVIYAIIKTFKLDKLDQPKK